jgi:hypothetical protein
VNREKKARIGDLFSKSKTRSVKARSVKALLLGQSIVITSGFKKKIMLENYAASCAIF